MIIELLLGTLVIAQLPNALQTAIQIRSTWSISTRSYADRQGINGLYAKLRYEAIDVPMQTAQEQDADKNRFQEERLEQYRQHILKLHPGYHTFELAPKQSMTANALPVGFYPMHQPNGVAQIGDLPAAAASICAHGYDFIGTELKDKDGNGIVVCAFEDEADAMLFKLAQEGQ